MKAPSSFPPADVERFLASFLYDEGGFLVDEIVAIDRDAYTKSVAYWNDHANWR